MTITLDRPTTVTPPAPRLSEDDALLAWVSNLSYGVRAYALALSDMPTSIEGRRAALGYKSEKGVGILPSRGAALMVARWAKQGVQRHPEGELGAWKADFVSRWTHRSGEMDVPAWKKICKPFGGIRRINAGHGLSSHFELLHPAGKPTTPLVAVLRVFMPAITLEEDSWGPCHHPAKAVTIKESGEDLRNLPQCIDGLVVDFRAGAFELTRMGKLLTAPEFQNLYRLFL